MKKIPIKAILSIILEIIICISVGVGIIYLQYIQSKKTNNVGGVYIRKQYLKELSCVPKKPIDKGVIFAEAMKQYWQADINYIWHFYDSNINSTAWDEQSWAEEIKSECGLEKNFWGNKRWFNKDTCYPNVTNANGSKFVYKPEQDEYLYKPQYYNQDTPFEVVRIRDAIKTVYPNDCCRLLTYQEMIKEQTEIEKQDNSSKISVGKMYVETTHYNKNTQKGYYIDDEHLLNQVLFLRIKSSAVRWVTPSPPDFDLGTSIRYYPVSLCGKSSYLTYFYPF